MLIKYFKMVWSYSEEESAILVMITNPQIVVGITVYIAISFMTMSV